MRAGFIFKKKSGISEGMYYKQHRAPMYTDDIEDAYIFDIPLDDAKKYIKQATGLDHTNFEVSYSPSFDAVMSNNFKKDPNSIRCIAQDLFDIPADVLDSESPNELYEHFIAGCKAAAEKLKKDVLSEKTEREESQKDMVNHPEHYEVGGLESIKVMEVLFGKEDVMTFCMLNAFKYIWRNKRKNGPQDLDKARWYLEHYLELSDYSSQK